MKDISWQNFNDLNTWSERCDLTLPQLFGLDVFCVYHGQVNKVHNRDEGTDAILRNFLGERYVRVDFKWSSTAFDKDNFFYLEDRQRDGTSWTTNKVAISLGVVVVYLYREDDDLQLAAYRLSDLAHLAETKRRDGVKPSPTLHTGTWNWACSRRELKDLEVWSSRKVPVSVARSALKKDKKTYKKRETCVNIKA